jgi:hypothetical protein
MSPEKQITVYEFPRSMIIKTSQALGSFMLRPEVNQLFVRLGYDLRNGPGSDEWHIKLLIGLEDMKVFEEAIKELAQAAFPDDPTVVGFEVKKA